MLLISSLGEKKIFSLYHLLCFPKNESQVLKDQVQDIFFWSLVGGYEAA